MRPMKLYCTYSALVSSPDRDRLLARHPRAARYNDFYNFSESPMQAFGEQLGEMTDLTHLTLIDDGATKELPTDITRSELRVLVKAQEADEHGEGGFLWNEACGKEMHRMWQEEHPVDESSI